MARPPAVGLAEGVAATDRPLVGQPASRNSVPTACLIVELGSSDRRPGHGKWIALGWITQTPRLISRFSKDHSKLFTSPVAHPRCS